MYATGAQIGVYAKTFAATRNAERLRQAECLVAYKSHEQWKARRMKKFNQMEIFEEVERCAVFYCSVQPSEGTCHPSDSPHTPHASIWIILALLEDTLFSFVLILCLVGLNCVGLG
ncbi:hypothetical protein J437_LFUL000938 [Ladona fulva]|uniref:Uncharacterized protein n=1 Tax=Ladona fulva TaxID=123851 RepID=A0A8K0P1C8_LADFU|nr:hypothetical protein J437_LFUL000938 [Ladona fulva]